MEVRKGGDELLARAGSESSSLSQAAAGTLPIRYTSSRLRVMK